MLIVPMTMKIKWSNPPIVTILLILVNCFVYFGLQSGDAEWSEKLWTHYNESGLARMEISRFVEHLKASGRTEGLQAGFEKKLDDPVVIWQLHGAMASDTAFMRKLESGQIITPGDPQYAEWQKLRGEQERLRSEMTSWKYGYKPSVWHPMTLITYMFLHGSAMHLIGNMVFLWLVGCILELSGRRSAYLVIYLLTGVLSAVSFGLVYKGSAVPLVGASGAISGIIGAYTVLYGRSKVKIFYSLGFYFGYMRVGAIFLLPVWVGNEIFQLVFGGISNVAYVAHVGGLVTGAVLGFGQRKLLGGVRVEPVEDECSEKLAFLVENGLQKLAELDLGAARVLMLQALDLDPESPGILIHLFNIDKLSPEREEIHKTAAQLFLCLSQRTDAQSYKALYDTYREYCRVAKHPSLPSDVWSRLGAAFTQRGLIEDAAKIVALLLRTTPQLPTIPNLLLGLSRAYAGSGNPDKGKDCLRLLARRFPESTESRIAQELLGAAA